MPRNDPSDVGIFAGPLHVPFEFRHELCALCLVREVVTVERAHAVWASCRGICLALPFVGQRATKKAWYHSSSLVRRELWVKVCLIQCAVLIHLERARGCSQKRSSQSRSNSQRPTVSALTITVKRDDVDAFWDSIAKGAVRNPRGGVPFFHGEGPGALVGVDLMFCERLQW